MPDIIKFKEPERCDYLYVDEHNKVHIILPIVGGDEIGLDNTCETSRELTSFFYGSRHDGIVRSSAEAQLTEYKRQLEEDIKAIHTQKKISPLAFTDLLKAKVDRLKQIEQYIQLIKVVKDKYDADQDLSQLHTTGIPQVPAAVKAIIRSAENAFAVRLSPYDNDKFTRFDDPVFSIKRNISKYEYSQNNTGQVIPITEGLGYRLRTTFFPEDKTPSPIKKKKSLRDTLIDTVVAQVNDPDYLKGADRAEKLQALKVLVQQELQKIDSKLSAMKTRDERELDIDIDYLELMGMNIDDSLKDWVDSILFNAVDPTVWEFNEPLDIFYDGATQIGETNNADTVSTSPDTMSLRVQYLLAEVNIYCRSHDLSKLNFGVFFDKEPHASQIAINVKKGLAEGAPIEPIIYEYINSHHADPDLGLSTPLTSVQQQAITEQFTQHFNTIKASPHFDEFFVADTKKKGAIFSHQGRMSCHFLDFFARHTKGAHPLGDLAGYSAELQSGPSRLAHKNDVGYTDIDKFKQQVVKLLAENKPKELVAYLAQTSPTGAPNYSLLSFETQNYISHNRNWPAIKQKLQLPSPDVPVAMQKDLLRLLSRKNVNHEHLSAITWSKFSSKPLLEIELSKVAEGLTSTADIYEAKRGAEWFKGSKNKSRERQCNELKDIAKEIDTLLKNPSGLSRTEILDTLLKSIIILDKIDAEISQERNLFKSSLQREVKNFKTKLQDICQLQNYSFKSTLNEIISFEMEEQFKKIINPEVQKIVRELPSHCHTDEAIDFFKTLTPAEATKVASYLSLEYREINKSTNKQTLLDVDIPKLFKQVNTQLLSELKAETVISDEIHDQLSLLADKIPPELFTRKNIEKWATMELTEENLDTLLKAAQPTTPEVARDYRTAMQALTGRDEQPSVGNTLS